VDYRTRAAKWLLGATAHPGGEALTEHLLDRMSLTSGAMVLDVACGAGASLRILARRGHLGVGVDLQPDTRQAIVADAQMLPFAASSYDAVLCECALSTFDQPGQALAEMHRVLRPGGLLGMTDVVLRRDLASASVIAAVDRLTTAQALTRYADLLRGAGFDVVATEDRRQDAVAMLKRLRRRLPLARTLRDCAEAVSYGSLGYGLLIGRKAE
jgi:ubiquinone/menaquinone biosynthesis C-methylase UbiE